MESIRVFFFRCSFVKRTPQVETKQLRGSMKAPGTNRRRFLLKRNEEAIFIFPNQKKKQVEEQREISQKRHKNTPKQNLSTYGAVKSFFV